MVLTHKLHSEALRLRVDDPELSSDLINTFAALVEERPTLDATLENIIEVAVRVGVTDRGILYIRNMYELEES